MSPTPDMPCLTGASRVTGDAAAAAAAADNDDNDDDDDDDDVRRAVIVSGSLLVARLNHVRHLNYRLLCQQVQPNSKEKATCKHCAAYQTY